MNSIKKAIIPIAGLGTRFLPATKTVPKTLFPILDTPILQLILEELNEAGITEVALVISENQRSITKHFTRDLKLEKTLKKTGKTKELEKLKKTKLPLKIHYFLQNKPLGDGHAILKAKSFLKKGENCIVCFGDEIILNHNAKNAAHQLIEEFKRVKTPIVGVQQVEKKQKDRYGIVEHIDGKVTKLLEKPKPNETDSCMALIGKYIINNEIMKELASIQREKEKELRLIDGMKKYMKSSNMHVCNVTGKRFDTGSKLGLILANLHFGLIDEEIGMDLKRHISSL